MEADVVQAVVLVDLEDLEPRTDWDYAGAVRSAPVPITGHEVGQLQVYPGFWERWRS